MYYYFSSSYPAVIKLNGIYFGKVFDTVKHLKTDDEVFVEVCSLDCNERGVNFILSNEFLSSPPTYTSVTDLNGGYLLHFNRSYSLGTFKIIAQEKFHDAVVTVFRENGYKISIETPSDFYTETVRFAFSTAQIQRREINGKILLFVKLVGESNLLLAYLIDKKTTRVLYQTCSDCETEQSVNVTEKHSDIFKHLVTTLWEFDGEKMVAISKKVERQKDLPLERINTKLLPYCFFEEYLVGGNFLEFIDGLLKENADKLSGFLGDYIGVMPPPVFRDIDEVGLIYKQGENVYSVQYFKAQTENGKIINLTKS